MLRVPPRVRTSRARAYWLPWALATGCRGLTDPPLPAGAVRFEPPPAYARWWAMTEACAGRTGDFRTVRWYVAPGASSVPVRGEAVAGYWSGAGNRIVLAGTVAGDGGVVRHEMLHALLRQRGHAREAFVGRCDGVVACDSACYADDPAGARLAAAVAAAARPVTPGALEVAVTVDPASPSRAEDGGAFRVTVTARNPQPVAVVVRTPPELREPPGYRYYLWSPSGMANGGRLEVSPDERVFAPGQTRRAVFDFVVAGAARADGLPPAGVVLRPDTYVVQGSLDGQTATREGLVLRP